MSDAPSAVRLRPRLSLRSLLLVVTIAAVWMGYVKYRAASRDAALAALQPQVVIWDHEYSSQDKTEWDPAAKPPSPSWLDTDAKQGLFARVRGVIMVRPQAKGEIWRLRDLPDLFTLNLSGSNVDDESLKVVARLDQLRSLNLNWTPITDAGLAEVAKLAHLEVLWLEETRVTDAGVKQLAALSQLRRLNLEATDVTDAGVARMRAALPQCEIWWGRPSAPQDDPHRSEPRQ